MVSDPNSLLRIEVMQRLDEMLLRDGHPCTVADSDRRCLVALECGRHLELEVSVRLVRYIAPVRMWILACRGRLTNSVVTAVLDGVPLEWVLAYGDTQSST